MYFFTLPGFKCLFVIQEIIVFKEQLVCEDGRVKNNLLLLQFTLQFLFWVTSVLEQHFCNFFDLSLDVEVEAPPSGPVLMFDNFDFYDFVVFFVEAFHHLQNTTYWSAKRKRGIEAFSRNCSTLFYIFVKIVKHYPVLQHDHALALRLHKEGGGLHLGEGELEIVVEVVKVEEEVTDTAAQGEQQVAVARVRGELDEVFAHPFIELLILQTVRRQYHYVTPAYKHLISIL